MTIGTLLPIRMLLPQPRGRHTATGTTTTGANPQHGHREETKRRMPFCHPCGARALQAGKARPRPTAARLLRHIFLLVSLLLSLLPRAQPAGRRVGQGKAVRVGSRSRVGGDVRRATTMHRALVRIMHRIVIRRAAMRRRFGVRKHGEAQCWSPWCSVHRRPLGHGRGRDEIRRTSHKSIIHVSSPSWWLDWSMLRGARHLCVRNGRCTTLRWKRVKPPARKIAESETCMIYLLPRVWGDKQAQQTSKERRQTWQW